jgi:predicted RNase H-like nuclease (RuvC/YqgF family)
MFSQFLQIIVLAPFKGLNKMLEIIFFPPKNIRYVEDENQDLQNQKKRLERVLQLQVSNNSALETSLVQMDREHRREIKQMEEYYEKKIRNLQQELKSMQWRRINQP